MPVSSHPKRSGPLGSRIQLDYAIANCCFGDRNGLGDCPGGSLIFSHGQGYLIISGIIESMTEGLAGAVAPIVKIPLIGADVPVCILGSGGIKGNFQGGASPEGGFAL